MYTAPDVSESSPARQCISVLLPDPDGPMIAVYLAGLERDGDAVEGADLALADAVDLDCVDGTGGRPGGWRGGDDGCLLGHALCCSPVEQVRSPRSNLDRPRQVITP